MLFYIWQRIRIIKDKSIIVKDFLDLGQLNGWPENRCRVCHNIDVATRETKSVRSEMGRVSDVFSLP